jgi:hypothetical protein
MSDEDNNVIDDTLNVTADDTQGDVSGTDTNDNTDDSSQDSDDVEQLREQNKKLFERAKKAEGFVKDTSGNWIKKPKPVVHPPVKPTQQSDNFNLEDVAVLVSNVPLKEDRDVVKKFAKLENKSLEDALRDPIVRGILKERAEERKTAEVANTSPSRRTTAKVSDEALIQKAEQGDWPDDPEALVEARFNQKKKK